MNWINPFTASASASATTNNDVAKVNRRDGHWRQQRYHQQPFQYQNHPRPNVQHDINCNPCNNVPWVPIAAPIRDSKSIVGFVHPSEIAQPHNQYGPPSNHYGPPSNSYLPPSINLKLPSNQYGPPSNNYGPPSNSYLPPANNYKPSSGQYNNYEPPPQLSNQYLPVFTKQKNYNTPSLTYGPSVMSNSYQQRYKIPATNYGVPIESTKFQFSPKTNNRGPSVWLTPPKSQNHNFGDIHSSASQIVLSHPPIPFPNMSPYQILPIFDYGNELGQKSDNSAAPSNIADITIDIKEHKMPPNSHPDVKIVESIPIADFTSVQHPVNYIQSPIIDLTVNSQNFSDFRSPIVVNDSITLESKINDVNTSSFGSAKSYKFSNSEERILPPIAPPWQSNHPNSIPVGKEKKAKSVQIIIPYLSANSGQNGPIFGRKVPDFNNEDFADAQGSASAVDVHRLQQTIDGWTEQEFNHNFNNSQPLVSTKSIPKDFWPKVKSIGTTSTTLRTRFDHDDENIKSNTVPHWDKIQLGISPVTNETVYVVTPMPTSTETFDGPTIVKSKVISYREWPNLSKFA